MLVLLAYSMLSNHRWLVLSQQRGNGSLQQQTQVYSKLNLIWRVLRLLLKCVPARWWGLQVMAGADTLYNVLKEKLKTQVLLKPDRVNQSYAVHNQSYDIVDSCRWRCSGGEWTRLCDKFVCTQVNELRSIVSKVFKTLKNSPSRFGQDLAIRPHQSDTTSPSKGWYKDRT